MSHFTGTVLKELDRAFNQGTISGLSEGNLLERFVSHHDEAAFSALVARHGPMVLGVCRRLLRDESDVDDAFQATFLVLVRRAARSAAVSWSATGSSVSLIAWPFEHAQSPPGATCTSPPGCRSRKWTPRPNATPTKLLNYA